MNPTIRNDERFRCILNMDCFIDFSIKNVRKLWKIMFQFSWRNEEAIEIFRQWLPNIRAELAMQAEVLSWEVTFTIRAAEEARTQLAAFGSVATVELRKTAMETKREAKRAELVHKRAVRECAYAEKLQNIFDEMCKKYL